MPKLWRLVGLLLTIILGFFSRCLLVGRESLWFDEAVSFLTAELTLTQIINNTVQDPHPPFYYALLHGWFKLLSPSDVNGRYLSLIFNILTILLIYWLTNRLLQNQKLALLAVGLTAVSPFHILYSHELRMYTLLMLLTTALAGAYWQARQTQRIGWWLFFTCLSLLAMYTHLFTAFALLAIGLHALIHWPERPSLYKTIIVGGVVVILFLPWLYLLTGESQIEIGSLRPLQSDAESFNPIKPLTSIAFLLFGQASTLWYGGLVFFLVIATTTVYTVELVEARKQKEDLTPLQLPALLVVSIIGIPNLVYFINPFFLPERTMAAASPFLLILLAWGVTRRRSPLPYLIGATAVTMIVGTAAYLLGDLVKPPYRDAIQFIAEQHQVGDAILHTSDGSYLPALSYIPLSDHALLAGDPDMRKPATVYDAFGGEIWELNEISGNRLWLIVALEHSVAWQQQQVASIDDHYPLLSEYDFAGIQVYLYDLAATTP